MNRVFCQLMIKNFNKAFTYCEGFVNFDNNQIDNFLLVLNTLQLAYFQRTIDKLTHLLTKDTDGYDVVDFRVGTIIGTFGLLCFPIFNYYFKNTIPDYPLGRNILIGVQIFSILASYRFTFFKRWGNEIGNLFSLTFAFSIITIVFVNGFTVRDSAFALIATFAMMGMFKEKRLMLYYTFIVSSYLILLILMSDMEASAKYFLIVTLVPLFSMGIYMFSLKLDAVDDLKKNEGELKQREAWFRNIFDNAPVGIVLYDEYHHPFKYNKFILELLGYSEMELSQIGIQNLVQPDDMILEIEFFDFKNDDKPHFFEQRLHTKDGKQLWVRIKIAKMVIENRDFTISMYNDITVEKNIDIQLRESSQLLKSQNEALEEFSYVISHDLQEPLRMITSFSQIIQNRYILKLNNEQANTDFAFVIDGAKRMSNLIKDMLEYSRWTAKSFPVERVDTREVLAETLQNLTYRLSSSQAEILTEDLPIIFTNKLMLGQVFQNLIGNAVRYRHPDRLPLISIKVEKRLFDIQFSIKDNGLGFEEKYKERIFGIFQRLYPDKGSGTGMGLAICKRIIEKQGGTIWAESVLDEGSTFFFTLPYREINNLENEFIPSSSNITGVTSKSNLSNKATFAH